MEMVTDMNMMIKKKAFGEVSDMDKCYERLIAEMSQENPQALGELYQHTKTAVYGFALSILKSPQTAEDVMQETYIKVYYAAPEYRSQGKPMAWVLTIVRNLSLMKLRENRKIVDFPLEESLIADRGGDAMEKHLDRMALDAALSVLNDQERQIVILHSISGLKHREIAALLAIPLSTTLSKYRRALSKINKQMKEDA